MTSPSNKRRDGNARAFAVRDKVRGGVSKRDKPTRASPYGRRLEELRKRRRDDDA